MANDDSHPADGLAQSFHDLISGEGFKQTLRQAWDRITGHQEQPQESPEVKAINDNLNAHRNDAANASFAAAQAKMKGQANSYDSTQKKPLKVYSK